MSKLSMNDYIRLSKKLLADKVDSTSTEEREWLERVAERMKQMSGRAYDAPNHVAWKNSRKVKP